MKNKLLLLIICFFVCEVSVIFCFINHTRQVDEKKIEIYVAYHKNSPLYQTDILIPIQGGRALHSSQGKILENIMIGDDTGDNISYLNDRYSELTVLYWIWKNSKADYVGLMHYRRFLNLAHNDRQFINRDKFLYYGFTSQHIAKLMQNADIVIARPEPLNVGKNLYDHYAHHHFKQDLDTIIYYAKQNDMKIGQALDYYLHHANRYNPRNIFIAKKEVIDAYCEWLFDILARADNRLKKNHLSEDNSYKWSPRKWDYQKRSPGFIAERLFSFWAHFNKNKYRVIEKPFILLDTNSNLIYI
ncbi:MAG: DUF4422 domain-containing protein [Alphaproteobacteria bacterium]|nr:DUF4422 domain-containing protein [Alphaproteobacteria bacterium]